ncbi:septum formation family protein [Solicola gregarius]|uniref:Septum formation family protein n=1 Tax=Solicola gregarius TaxID=2908642 RepID=A0AA46TIF8_9ACTN|nr:septum formation family protein [Solicola gregarius]UYM05735.1 septum formation family protein [Solicola gregarius]
MRTPSLARALILFACTTLLVAGCNGDDSPDAAGESDDPTSSETTSEPPPPPPPAPEQARCYQLSGDEVAQAHSDADPVACKKRHTSQTYAVGRLQKNLVGRDAVLDSNAIAAFVDKRCAARFTGYVGGDAETRTLARVHHVWFVPTEDEITRGAHWFRCDVIANGSGGAPAALPAVTKGLLAADDALDSWGTCDRSGESLNPEADWRLCSEPHNWQAIGTLSVGERDASWPGRDDLQARGDECEATVRDYLGDSTGALTFQWSYPTSAQWRDGRRYGLCWTQDQ